MYQYYNLIALTRKPLILLNILSSIAVLCLFLFCNFYKVKTTVICNCNFCNVCKVVTLENQYKLLNNKKKSSVHTSPDKFGNTGIFFWKTDKMRCPKPLALKSVFQKFRFQQVFLAR